MRTRSLASLALAPLAALLGGFAAAPAPRDLDVGIPPGSPLEWSASFPAYTPPRVPLFPETGPEAAKPDAEQRSSAKRAQAEGDVRFANAYGQVRILTWDLGAHLPWTMQPVPGPETGRATMRPAPPKYGEPLYWLALAPLLRLLLHPDALVRSETLAHLVELGEATLPVLGAAAAEKDLAPACRELRALIRIDLAATPEPPRHAGARTDALARFVLEECLRDHPLDPSDDFGRRLFLFAEDAEPWLRTYAHHPALTLSRNAVAALGRYETRAAVEFLAALAARTDDPVTLVRACAAVGRFRGALDVGPLVTRLVSTNEPVQRAALIGALGRLGAREAAPALLELGERARKAEDSDLLASVLSALARIAWLKPQPEIAALCDRIADEAKEIGGRTQVTVKPDLPDSPTLRAEMLRHLAVLARSQADPLDEETREALLALAEPSPLDPRLSANGLGGIDPLGNLAPPVRTLWLEGLTRAGPGGIEQLASLARRGDFDVALRARALALLPYDQRSTLAVGFLADPALPVELRIQALEVLIGDEHARADELCRAQLASPVLAQPRPPGGELYLTLRAVRHLSERGKLKASELMPLYPLVRLPLAERAARIEELRTRASELVEKAMGGARAKELEPKVAELVDFAIVHELNALVSDENREARIDLVMQLLQHARQARDDEGVAEQIVTQIMGQLLQGEAEVEQLGQLLFQPNVPLAEEVCLALGRTKEPLAIELLLGVLARKTRELRGHAALGLGMCGKPEVAHELAALLLDEDPFVRFCASESLRRLTGREPTVDWIGAPAEERAKAAEELKAWLLKKR